MNDIFLGKPIHWVVIVALVACGWLAGRLRLHFTDFNLFVIALIAVAVAALLFVIWTARPGERVTRDAIEDDDA